MNRNVVDKLDVCRVVFAAQLAHRVLALSTSLVLVRMLLLSDRVAENCKLVAMICLVYPTVPKEGVVWILIR